LLESLQDHREGTAPPRSSTDFKHSSLAAGKITAAEGQEIDAGAAGKYTVGKDGEVQYNKPLMFTKDNIDSFNY
jgi:hypothetical protein